MTWPHDVRRLVSTGGPMGGLVRQTGNGGWEYEPARFFSSTDWTPDFRLALNDGEAYAEVKPVKPEFPMDVAQRMLNSGWTGDILILGQGPAPRLALPRRRLEPGFAPASDLAA